RRARSLSSPWLAGSRSCALCRPMTRWAQPFRMTRRTWCCAGSIATLVAPSWCRCPMAPLRATSPRACSLSMGEWWLCRMGPPRCYRLLDERHQGWSLSVLVCVAMAVEPRVEMSARLLEDATIARLPLRVGRRRQGVEPGEAALQQREHVGGVGGAEQLLAAGDDVYRRGMRRHKARRADPAVQPAGAPRRDPGAAGDDHRLVDRRPVHTLLCLLRRHDLAVYHHLERVEGHDRLGNRLYVQPAAAGRQGKLVSHTVSLDAQIHQRPGGG